jgi:dissimilatory sulfite reductase (desulfoviridin) alpha/beta subunit
MVASKKISECIKKLGFEKFFTTMIKQFIKKEANL